MTRERRMPSVEKNLGAQNKFGEATIIFDLSFKNDDKQDLSRDHPTDTPETGHAHIIKMERGAKPLNPDGRIVKKIELEAPRFTKEEFSWFIPDTDEPENS